MWKPVSTLSALALAFLLSWLIGFYYRRRFVRVSPARRDYPGSMGMAIPLGLFVAFLVDIAPKPPVSVAGLATAAWMPYHWRRVGGIGVHYAVMAAPLALASLLPLTGAATPAQHFGVVLPLALGTVVVVGGLLDHLTLVKAMSSFAGERGAG